jgi:hypothetical protein
MKASRSVLLAAAALAATTLAPAAAQAAAAPATLDTNPAAPQVAGWAGTLAWSHYDAAAKDWRLVYSVNGGPVVAAPVAPSPVPFDVDLGTNRNGSTYAVYTRCAQPSTDPRDLRGTDCDIYRLGLATGREEHLTSISSPTRDERDPTIFRGEIAFVRDEPVSHRPGQVLRIANTTSGSHGTRAMAKSSSQGIRDPELSYDRIAYVVTYAKGRYGFGQQEVHIRTLSGRSARNAYTATSGGANFANITNLSVTDADLHAFVFARTNNGSGAGNRIVRYDDGARRLTYAAGSPRYRSVAWVGGDAGTIAVVSEDAEDTFTVSTSGLPEFDLRP